jgi:hypothetical protein
MTFMELFARPYPAQNPLFTQVLVTPDLARTWLLCYRYARQRSIRDYRIREIEEMMRYGTFRDYSILTFGRWQNLKSLLNGYHRLEAVCQFGEPVWFTIEERDVGSLEALDHLYDTYDREMMRSYMDLLKASDFANLNNVTPTTMKVLHSAMPLVISGFTDSGHIRGSVVSYIIRDTQHVMHFMTDWLDEAEQYMVALSGVETRSQRLFYRASVMSVALITLRFVPEHASSFWRKASHQTGFDEGDVEKVLSNYLRDNAVTPNRRIDYARYVASAWNGHIDDKGKLKDTDRSRLSRGRSRAFILHGTPFKGQEDLWFVGDDRQPLRNPVAKRREGYGRTFLDEMTTAETA